MRIEGTLSKWNDDRGFGFITPAQGGQEIFVHISEFPKDGRRPAVGEKLNFEVEASSSGKPQARNVVCPQRPAVVKSAPARRSPTSKRRSGPGFFGRVIPPLLLAGLLVFAYNEQSRHSATLPRLFSTPSDYSQDSSSFSCDGRTHCSQMTSCAEAKYFLQNCPNVQMDGNHDGVPCQQQWCN